MWKSFGYDSVSHEFILARNVVGDFGLHLSLIRSFSWGSNIPVESPFYPGVPLPYHFLLDSIAGLTERSGVRIDIAYNGISAVGFTALLILIYKISQRLFKPNRFIGVTSVLLFIFHSSLTFIDFFRDNRISSGLLQKIWTIPNYIHAGPFDGSLISTFFTLNVFVNQRHTIVGLALGLWVIYELMPMFLHNKTIAQTKLLVLGSILGVLSWTHTLLFMGFIFVLILFCLLYRRLGYIAPLIFTATIFFLPHAISIIQVTGNTRHVFYNPGFLSTRPVTIQSFVYYWWLNLGIAIICMSCGVMKANKNQRLFFIPFLFLFITANILQFSYRIDHNHTLINLFIIIANLYIAWFLWYLWQKGLLLKTIAVLLLFFLTISGVLDLMVVKNDYHLRVADAPKNALMQWIRSKTDPRTIFISSRQLLDPVTLAGRKNFVGHDYYLSVMGYAYVNRLKVVKQVYETPDIRIIDMVKQGGVQFIIIPNADVSEFWKTNAEQAYKDNDVTVYKL